MSSPIKKTDVKCPECKKEYLGVRFGKAGEFLGCLSYPDCTYTCNFERTEDNKLRCIEIEKPKELDLKCEKCDSNLREIIGRYGKFIACSAYPECKYVYREKAPFKCPLDKKGDVVKRKWRGGTLWGCGNYPKCKFAVFGDIELTKCPECKLPFLVKKVSTKGVESLQCSSKECGYKK